MTRLRTVLFALILAVSAVVPGQMATAGDGVTLSSAPAAAGGVVVTPPRSAAEPASYCRSDCDRCRSYCYGAYRVNCYGDHCRRSFTLCMRDCWNTICRYCGY